MLRSGNYQMINKLKQYLLHESRIANTDPINYEEFVRDYYF